MSYAIQEKQDFLDLFYKYYPEEYKDIYYDGITTSDMVSDLKNYHSGPYSHILKLYDSDY